MGRDRKVDEVIDTLETPIDIRKAQRRQAELSALAERIAQAEDKQAAFTCVASAAPKVLGVPRCTIAEPDSDGPTFTVTVLEGLGVLLQQGTRMLLPGTAVGEAIATNRVITTKDHDLDDFGDWRHLRTMGLAHFVCCPISNAGTVVATLNIGAPETRPFDALDEHFASQVALLLGRRLAVLP